MVFGVIACIFLLLTCAYPAYPSQPAAWAPVFFFLAYFLYLCEALICVCAPCLRCGFGSSTFAYVSNIMSDTAAENFVASLMAAAPVFVMHVECCASMCCVCARAGYCGRSAGRVLLVVSDAAAPSLQSPSPATAATGCCC